MEDLIYTLKEQIIETLNLEEMTPEDIKDDVPLFGGGYGLDFIDVFNNVLNEGFCSFNFIADKFFVIFRPLCKGYESFSAIFAPKLF